MHTSTLRWHALPPRPPNSATTVSIDSAMAMRTTFAQGSPAVLALFDALVDLLTGGTGHRHQRPHSRDALVAIKALMG